MAKPWILPVALVHLILASTLNSQAPESRGGSSKSSPPISPWASAGLGFGRVDRDCPTCLYEASPFGGIAVVLAGGISLPTRWRFGVEANQWFEIGVTERADKRQFAATLTTLYAIDTAKRFRVKLGAGVSHHWEGNPEVAATGAVAQLGAYIRLRNRRTAPVAMADYFETINADRGASRTEAAGPFKARLLRVGLGLDWEP